MKKTLTVEGMTCNHCSMHVGNALRAVPGVTAVNVILAKKRAEIELEPSVTDEALKSAVDGAGYSVTAIAQE